MLPCAAPYARSLRSYWLPLPACASDAFALRGATCCSLILSRIAVSAARLLYILLVCAGWTGSAVRLACRVLELPCATINAPSLRGGWLPLAEGTLDTLALRSAACAALILSCPTVSAARLLRVLLVLSSRTCDASRLACRILVLAGYTVDA